MLKYCPNCEDEVEVKHSICQTCGEEFHGQSKTVKFDEWEETDEWTDTAFDEDL